MGTISLPASEPCFVSPGGLWDAWKNLAPRERALELKEYHVDVYINDEPSSTEEVTIC